MRYIIIGQTYQQASYYYREYRDKFRDRRGVVISMAYASRSLRGVRDDTEVIVLDNCWFGPFDQVMDLDREVARLKALGVTVRSGGEWLG